MTGYHLKDTIHALTLENKQVVDELIPATFTFDKQSFKISQCVISSYTHLRPNLFRFILEHGSIDIFPKVGNL